MKKRMFAMLLSLTMVLAMFPATAMAAEDDGINTAAELTAAIAAAEDGSTIELSGNVTLPTEEGITIDGKKNITIKLGEFTISGSKNYLILAKNGASVTLTATTGGVETNKRHVATVMTDATMTINGGTYLGEISTWQSGEITLNNVTVSSVKYVENDSSYAVYAQEGGKITINGGSFTNAIRTDNYDAAVVACKDGAVEINGDAHIAGEYALACNAQCNCTIGGTIIVNDGTFEGEAGILQTKNDVGAETSAENVKFNGGTINVDTAEELIAAVAAANEGTGFNSIALTAPVTMPEETGLTITKDLTIDLGTHKIVGSKNYLILAKNGASVTLTATTGGVETNKRHVATVMENATMTINGGTYLGEISTWQSGEITLNNVTVSSVKYSSTDSSYAVYAQEGGKITINGGSFTNAIRADYYDVAVVACKNGIVEINDNAHVAGEYALACNAQCNCTIGGAIIVNGGTFEGEAGILQTKNDVGAETSTENVSITGGTFDADVKGYLNDDYIAASNGDGTWTVMADEVSEVTLNKTSANLTVGKTLQLEATVVPAEATDKTVTWSSSDVDVATVDENGKVTAVAVGEAEITATAGEKSATCTVTVEKKAASKPSTSGSTGGSSSGSTGGSTTTTEKNPDGSSTTTQVNNATGTVTETTKNTDGSTETVKTEKDGTVTTNVAAADGSKSETVVDKSGVQSSEVTVSNKAVTEAAKAGEAVALPIPEVKATSNSSKAATVTVELPANVKTAEVEVPVANVNAGTVAVIVHADGTEEVVRDCVPTEDGIALNVANGATVKIVDNSRDFADVSAAHSFSDAVDFASARGIVEGYSNGSFGVGGYATSAATATVIARIMGEDFYGSGSTTKAQNWAKENGIAAGLDLSGNVNRVDFMTMLWRAAGSPSASTTLSFTDASSIAASAMDAMAWAVEVGLIGGYDDGSVRPEANITRGAMAAIAQRYLMAK